MVHINMTIVGKLFTCMLAAVCLLQVAIVRSAQVVRMDIEFSNQVAQVDLLLFDEAVPNTVQNFLNYVDDGAGGKRYNNSFFHRAVNGFVLQGGGYTFDESLGGFEYDASTDSYPGGLQKIPTDSPIVNEFAGSGLSNVRGTLAMAKLSGDPDSATSQWFVNLADNSSNLDNQNGGFTVFGRVVDAGMDVIEQVMAMPQIDLSSVHPAMGAVPLSGYTDLAGLGNNNVARIVDVRQVARPVLSGDTLPADFGLVVVGDSATQVVQVVNEGNADLVMDTDSISGLSPPFSIISENCSGVTLSPGAGSCEITVSYSPTVTGNDNALLEITPTSNPDGVVLRKLITADAVPTTPVLTIEGGITSLDFGQVPLESSENRTVTIQNRGGGTLLLTSLTITGEDSSQFVTDAACDGVSLALSESCTVLVSYQPTVEKIAQASLAIVSSEGVFNVELSGQGLGPEIEYLPTAVDFGAAQIMETKYKGIEIRSIGASPLRLTSVAITGPDSSSFGFQSNCPDIADLPEVPLGPNKVCSIVLTYTPLESGPKSAVLTFTTNDLDESLINIPLSGFVDVPDIDIADVFDLGVAQTGVIPSYKTFTVTNRGMATLEFTSMRLTGNDSNIFLAATNCPGIATYGTLAPLENMATCEINLQFNPSVEGEYTAQLELGTNDPNDILLNIDLKGLGDRDVDGILFSEELAAPNAGDGNNDGISDDGQNHVASLRTQNGQYLTLYSPPGTILFEVGDTGIDGLGDLPADLGDLQHGVITFNLDSIPLSGTVQLLLLLPEGDMNNLIYVFGATPDNPEPQWFNFDYDGVTGAKFLGQVRVEPPGGGLAISRNVFSITFVDGLRGDLDLVTNNTIVASIAPARPAAVDAGGGMGVETWLISLWVLALVRLRRSEL